MASAACKRLTEALRTLEEYAKTIAADQAGQLESLRYAAYDLEQRLARRIAGPGWFEHVRLYVLLTSRLCRSDPLTTARAVIDGGAGNDHLKAGGGPTVMMGADGNDMLIGGKGSDILIGGPGRDRLVGGPGDDVLIGAATLFDTDYDAVTADFDAPLVAILAEWNADRDYDTRVANLTGAGDGERLNEDYFLDGTTVLGGEMGDKITGASGENWSVDGMPTHGKHKRAASHKT